MQVTFSPSLKLRDVVANSVCVTIVTLFLSGSSEPDSLDDGKD